MKKLLVITMPLLVAVLLLVGCSQSNSTSTTSTTTTQTTTSSSPATTYELRLATDYAPTDPLSIIMKTLETSVPQATNGRVTFKLYLASTLYNQIDAVTALSKGDLEMAVGGEMLGETGLFPEWQAIAHMAYLFDNYAHLQRFLNSDTYKALCDKMTSQGIMPITKIYPSSSKKYGFLIWNSKRQVNVVSDLAGLKIGYYPIDWNETFLKALGTAPTAVPLSEYITSLTTKVVDGTLSGADLIPYVEGTAKILPWATPIYSNYGLKGLVISTKFWNSLPSDIQGQLQTVFDQTWETFDKGNDQNMEGYIAKYISEGGTITDLPPAEFEKARDLVREAYKPLLASKGPEIQAIVAGVDSCR